MSKEVLQELQKKKQQVRSIIEEARKFGWLDNSKADEEIQRLDKDKLTIGVIGQMKSGKSTFLNSFIFENDILPAATTPMTASLGVITYGEKNELIAEFYTRQEWDELKYTAERSLENVKGNSMEESKIKAAKELIEKSSMLGSSLDSYLGTTKKDELSNLIEYVGADGKFIAITKSVTIHYNQDYLKGVQIVDTPGFNDPVVSREERTRDFLKHADVVLLMLYAGRPFDATDREILFKDVALCGIPKVLIGINKYDIPYGNGETMNEIKSYVKDQILAAAEHYKSDLLKDLVEKVNPIPLSAEMALLSKLPMEKIRQNPIYNHAWNRHCDTFEISTQKQMREESHIDDLIYAVRKLIKDEKDEILIKKPLAMVLSVGENILENFKGEKGKLEIEIKSLQMPTNEQGQSIQEIRTSIKRVQKRIEILGLGLDEEIDLITERGLDKVRATLNDTKSDIRIFLDHLNFEPDRMNMIDGEINNKFTAMIEDMKHTIDSTVKSIPPGIEEQVMHFLRTLSEILVSDKFDCYQETVEQIKKSISKLFRDVDWLENVHTSLAINVGTQNRERMQSAERYNRDLMKEQKTDLARQMKEIESEIPEEELSSWDKFTDFFNSGKKKKAKEAERRETISREKKEREKQENAKLKKQTTENLKRQFEENKTHTRNAIEEQFNHFNPKVLFVNVKPNKENIINQLTNKIINDFLEPIKGTLEEVMKDESLREGKIAEKKNQITEVEASIKKVERELGEIKQMLK